MPRVLSGHQSISIRASASHACDHGGISERHAKLADRDRRATRASPCEVKPWSPQQKSWSPQQK
jgi:hypothetical protein